MNDLPVYTLDLNTRLQVDSLAFEENEGLTKIESLAFLVFKECLQFELQTREDQLKDEGHSLELLMLGRDIDAIMTVLNIYESTLQMHVFAGRKYSKEVRKDLAIYDMALRYRYALGLYDSDESFHQYWTRKTEEFESLLKVFKPDYSLPSLVFPLEDETGRIRSTYIDDLQAHIQKLRDEDDRFTLASAEIDYRLMNMSLPTKHDWNSLASGWKFGYMEQRAIQAELILHLKNGLREAYRNDYEWDIQKYVSALHVVYSHNLLVSGVEVQHSPVELAGLDYLDASFIQTGLLGASMVNAADTYADNVRMRGTRGHGIAAERANDFIDKAMGKQAGILGDDNVKDGADRLVNGEFIQTKYCATGGKAISECFDGNRFRYVVDGKPMQIEVPKDKYEQALQSMRDRIQRGDLNDLGITDPDYAEKIVRKGHVSYNTARRIAKAGTIEGVTYDAAKGMVTGLQTFGISTTISFASAIWRGENAGDALEQAVKDGSLLFGRHVMQHVLTQQVGRTAIEKSLRPATDYAVKNVLGSKTSAQIVNLFFRSAGQSSIYGAAAMNHLSKLMRGNIVTMAITTAVMSAGSIYDVINGRISRSQLFKNIGTTGAGVGGAAIGATVGSIVPVVGTIVGGLVGGIIGGKVSKKAFDKFIDDDSLATMESLKETFVANIEDLQLDRDELNYIVSKIFDEKKLSKELKLIYAAADREEYISQWMDPYIDAILKTRPRIKNIGQLIEAHNDVLVS